MSNDLQIYVEPTPNPNARKFIMNKTVKTEGKSTYTSCVQCAHNPMAYDLFTIKGVEQVYFFRNVITISKDWEVDWEEVEKNVFACLNDQIGNHNPDYVDPDPEKERREQLPPEVLEIELILDRTVRANLQADGGDVHCVSYKNNILLIRYQGACGTCPSSTTGTLRALKAILREEFNPDIDVFIAPEF